MASLIKPGLVALFSSMVTSSLVRFLSGSIMNSGLKTAEIGFPSYLIVTVSVASSTSVEFTVIVSRLFSKLSRIALVVGVVETLMRRSVASSSSRFTLILLSQLEKTTRL